MDTKTDLIAFIRPELESEIKELTGKSVRVTRVDSLGQLTDFLSENPFSVVLLDQDYSGLDIKFIGTLRSLYSEAIKLVLTEHPNLNMVIGLINSGAIFGFLQLPLDRGLFSDLVDRAVTLLQDRQRYLNLLDTVKVIDSEVGDRLVRRLQTLEHENFMLKQEVIVDPLTGCFNVRYMRYQLGLEFDKHLRYRETFSLLMMDLDDFKSINDTYGHPVGDKALIAAADSLRSSVRGSDVVIRYGGDEFMVIAPNTMAGGALAMAKRIENAIKGVKIATGQGMIRLSMSIGVVTCGPKDDSIDKLIERVDEALYKAKHAGKDKIVVLDMAD